MDDRTINLLEERGRIAGTKIFDEKENVEYDEFNKAIINERNSKKIKQKAKSELKKLKFRIDIDLVKLVTLAHKYLRIANSHWDEEFIANGIVDILLENISSKMSITC